MRKFLFFIIICFLKTSVISFAQADTIKYDGIKVIVPSEKNKGNGTTYFYFTGGYSLASWYILPMIPQVPKHMEINSDGNVKAPGWFAGIGLMKKTKTRFEVGLMGDFYKTRIPVAYENEYSESKWINEMSGNPLMGPFSENIERINEVIAIRALIRYKLSLEKIYFWGGIAPGTFTNRVYFSGDSGGDPYGEYRVTVLGVNCLTGIDFPIKNQKGKDVMMFTFYSDFGGPYIEETYVNLFKPGWLFQNKEENRSVNPVKLGFSMGFYL